MSAVLKVKSLLDVPHNQRQQMSIGESKTFIHMTMADLNEYLPYNTEISNCGIYGLAMFNQLNHYNVQASLPVIFFILTKCDNYNHILLWTYTLYCIQKKYDQPVRMDHLTKEFPWGFPTKEAIEEIWDTQKENDFHLLDQKENWN